jgi:protein TonB
MVQETTGFERAEQLELTFAGDARHLTCGSCGVGIARGDLCASCEEAFSSVLAPATTIAAATDPEPSEAPDRLVAAAASETARPEPERTVGSDSVETPFTLPPPAVESARSHAEPAIRKARPNVDRAAMVTVGAVIVVAMIGLPLGARWVERQLRVASGAAEHPPAPREPSAHQARKPVAHVETSTDVAARPMNSPHPTPPPVAQPRVVPTRPTRAAVAAPKPARPAAATEVAVAPPALNAGIELASSEPPRLPAPPPPAPEPQLLAAAEAPVGRLFDPSDVDEAPRIATRVEPQLSEGLPLRDGDVVIVRILVSHTGRPFRVNLLRRSRFGSEVDDAVVAAVRHWTFSPARRRGEPVSCWYNFGIALKGE